MHMAMAIVLAVWAAAACATPTAAPNPDESPAPTAAPAITPTPVGPPVRVLWAPKQPQELPVAIRVDPGVATAPTRPLVAASPEQLQLAERAFAAYFGQQLFLTLQNLRDQRFNGSEEWMFATTFAPGPFADHVREMVTTRRENQTRTFLPGHATLENAWVRPSNGPFGSDVDVALVEGTVTFSDEILTGADRTVEPHAWRVRALSQGQFLILDGTEGSAPLAPMPAFDLATLDSEVAAQVSNHLHQEVAGPQATPSSPFKGTAYWDARTAALDWLHELSTRGTLTDRHFENMRALITKFTPTSYLGDGYATVHLQGTLVEVIDGVRHSYPVNESVVFQRFSLAQATWTAVDGQNDDGTWIANGSYGTPQSTAHG